MDEDDGRKTGSISEPPDPKLERLFKARCMEGEPVIKENVLKKQMYKPGDTKCKLCDHIQHWANIGQNVTRMDTCFIVTEQIVEKDSCHFLGIRCMLLDMISLRGCHAKMYHLVKNLDLKLQWTNT